MADKTTSTKASILKKLLVAAVIILAVWVLDHYTLHLASGEADATSTDSTLVETTVIVDSSATATTTVVVADTTKK